MRKRTPTPRSIYQIHNLRKLSILLECFNFHKTAGQVSNNTHISGESFTDHRDKVAKTISRLRHFFKHPYLTSHHLKNGKEGGHIAYKCTPKGRRVCCELFYRKKKGIALNWNGRYHVQCCKDCSECENNPTLDPNYKTIILTPDTRAIEVMTCYCGYKRTFRVSPGTPAEIIRMKKEMLLKNHRMKEHGLGGYPKAVNDCRNTRRKKKVPSSKSK